MGFPVLNCRDDRGALPPAFARMFFPDKLSFPLLSVAAGNAEDEVFIAFLLANSPILPHCLFNFFPFHVDLVLEMTLPSGRGASTQLLGGSCQRGRQPTQRG